MAHRKHEKIPDGWAVDSEGNVSYIEHIIHHLHNTNFYVIPKWKQEKNFTHLKFLI